MIDTYNENGLAEQRKLFTELMNNGIKTPVIIGRAYGDLSEEQLQLSASSDLGGFTFRWIGRWNIYCCRKLRFLSIDKFTSIRNTCKLVEQEFPKQNIFLVHLAGEPFLTYKKQLQKSEKKLII